MTTDELLDFARRTGIVLQAQGDTLLVDAPTGCLSPELRQALQFRKPELLARLSVPQHVILANGCVLPIESVEVALNLERRGFLLSLDVDQQFTIEATGISGQLTSADHVAVSRWRHHLGAIVAHAFRVCA